MTHAHRPTSSLSGVLATLLLGVVSVAHADDATPTITGAQKDSPAAREAVKTYLAVVSAYNRGDTAAYFAGFAEELACFYGKTGYAITRVRSHRGKMLPAGGEPEVSSRPRGTARAPRGGARRAWTGPDRCRRRWRR